MIIKFLPQLCGFTVWILGYATFQFVHPSNSISTFSDRLQLWTMRGILTTVNMTKKLGFIKNKCTRIFKTWYLCFLILLINVSQRGWKKFSARCWGIDINIQDKFLTLLQCYLSESCCDLLVVNARPSIKHRQKRIVGGKPIKEPGKWPWIATLWYNKTHYCGGSIIDKKWIVTTAHCFNGKIPYWYLKHRGSGCKYSVPFSDAQTSNEPSDWLVKVGKHDLSKVESHEQCFKVKRIIRHPNYTSMWDTYRIDKPDDNDVGKYKNTLTEWWKTLGILLIRITIIEKYFTAQSPVQNADAVRQKRFQFFWSFLW